MHKKEDILNQIDEEAWEIGEALLKGILLEVSSFPKPGLVSSISMGSHRDMNILTFMVSSAAIAPLFYLCAQIGRNHKKNISELLPTIRKIGVKYEQKLLKSTKGINTQRGILFAGGILAAAAGYVSNYSAELIPDKIFDTVSKMTAGLVEKELININKKKLKFTAGEKLFLQYRCTGIRGEVENGFPSIRQKGLPELKKALNKGLNLNYCLIHTLLSLMTCVEDTTILWRKDRDYLKYVQTLAQNIINKGSVFTNKGLKDIEELDKYFVKNNISPGGSADLLAITISCYLLENKQFPVKIL